jgi:hypothetical protein
MAKLNKTESSQLLAMMERPGWAALIKLVAMTVDDLNGREVSGQNEFETLRFVFTRQGKVDALKEFFNGIENGESLSVDRT